MMKFEEINAGTKSSPTQKDSCGGTSKLNATCNPLSGKPCADATNLNVCEKPENLKVSRQARKPGNLCCGEGSLVAGKVDGWCGGGTNLCSGAGSTLTAK